MAFSIPQTFVSTTTQNSTSWAPGGGGSNIQWDATDGQWHQFLGDSNTKGPIVCPGHEFDSRLLEFSDGKIVAECTVCGDKLTMERIPGGAPVARIKDLIRAAKSLEPEALHATLPEFVALENMLDDEEDALAHARELLAIARLMIAKQLEQL